MSQRRLLAVVVGVAVLAAVGGWVGARRLQSSGEAQANTAPPQASLITVAVEQQSLASSVVVRGDLRREGSVDVEVSAGLGPAVITVAPPERGSVVSEGDVFVEVTGRPVLVLVGELPMFRDIVPGVEGDDVLQFEQALGRLGYDTGPVDGVYDEAMELAVSRWYTDAGYRASGPTLDEQDRLDGAASAVDEARTRLRSAEASLREASRPVPLSTRLQLDLGVDQLGRALGDIIAERDALQKAADEARTAAQTALDAALAASELAGERLAAAEAGTHPDSGAAPTADELTELTNEATAAAAAHVEATTVFDEAALAASLITGEYEPQISEASTNLEIQRAQRNETLAGQDTTPFAEGVTDATRAVEAASETLRRLEAEIGIDVPQTEIVFLPTLPRRVERSLAERGDVVDGRAVATVSGVDLVMDSAVSQADRPLVSVGDRVVADDEEIGVRLEGEISFIADQPGTNGVASTRFYMRIRLDPVDDGEDLAGNLRVVVPIETTAGEVLTVPLAALSAGADGTPRVQVERSSGEVEIVRVSTGLRAGGQVEVTPISGNLDVGDRVVVGLEGGSFADTDGDPDADGRSEPEPDTEDDG